MRVILVLGCFVTFTLLIPSVGGLCGCPIGFSASTSPLDYYLTAPITIQILRLASVSSAVIVFGSCPLRC